MNDEYKFDELWIAIVNKTEYELNKEQAQALKTAIGSGVKSVIFKDFVINTSYLEEFYFVRKFLKKEYQLANQPLWEEDEPSNPLPPEESRKKIAEIRAALNKKMSFGGRK